MDTILVRILHSGVIVVNQYPTDNIAPPIASCLGDLVTLCLLGIVSSVLINFVHTPLPLIVAICVVSAAICCTLVVRRNDEVRDLIWQGWSPLFGAMVISSATGIILDTFASRYQGFPLLAIVISGVFTAFMFSHWQLNHLRFAGERGFYLCLATVHCASHNEAFILRAQPPATKKACSLYSLPRDDPCRNHIPCHSSRLRMD